MFTQCLRKITQRCLRTIRNNYANVFTQTLSTFPMLTQLYYADFTQIIYAIHYAFYAVIMQIIYADFTLRNSLRSLHNSITQIHLRNYHNFFTQVKQIPIFITQAYAKGNLLML